jgi:7,8-dihydroneopterin aldolase/epimerase/oxygenase
MHDRVELKALTLQAILGVREHEQITPQPLVIDLSMELDLQEAGEDNRLDRSVDYAAVADNVSFLVTHGRFRLLETMGLAIARMLLLPPIPGEDRAPITAVELSLRKPAVLDGLAVPGVSIRRTAAGMRFATREIATGVRADTLVTTDWNSAHRLRLDPGAVVTLPPHTAARPLTAGPVREGDQLRNDGDGVGTVLVVGRPPWP